MRTFLFSFTLFFALSAQAQTIDTLKYYTPYIPDSTDYCFFIGNCLDPGWCEPIAVWFTPDSTRPDTSYHYYSIKEIRFSFANKDTAFSIHIGKQFPTDSNRIYRQTLSLSFANDINQNFANDGNYLFKSYNVSNVVAAQNINIHDNFWVLLEAKVSDINNTTVSDSLAKNFGHSFNAGSPANAWVNSGCDWIIEAVVQYQHGIVDGIDRIGQPVLPGVARLYQNYPNPFNGMTKIQFELIGHSKIDLTIYSIDGKEVRNLIKNQGMSAGTHGVLWDGKDNKGKEVSTGIYFIKLTADGNTLSAKLMYLK